MAWQMALDIYVYTDGAEADACACYVVVAAVGDRVFDEYVEAVYDGVGCCVGCYGDLAVGRNLEHDLWVLGGKLEGSLCGLLTFDGE